MADLQFSVIVNLVVKATDEEDAMSTVNARLGKWLTEEKDLVPGFGFPFGSLLYYGFIERQEKDRAQSLTEPTRAVGAG